MSTWNYFWLKLFTYKVMVPRSPPFLFAVWKGVMACEVLLVAMFLVCSSASIAGDVWANTSLLSAVYVNILPNNNRMMNFFSKINFWTELIQFKVTFTVSTYKSHHMTKRMIRLVTRKFSEFLLFCFRGWWVGGGWVWGRKVWSFYYFVQNRFGGQVAQKHFIPFLILCLLKM